MSARLPIPPRRAILQGLKHALVVLAVAALAVPTAAQKGKPKKPAPKPPRTPEEIAADVETARRLDEARRASIEADTVTHFTICDVDANEWLSYREANLALGIDKAEYRRFDANSDGRMSLAEFRARYETLLETLGTSRTPVPSTDVLMDRTDAAREALRASADAPDAPPAAGRGARKGKPREKGPAGPPNAPQPESESKESAEPERLPRPFPAPSDLLLVFDADRSGGLSMAEVVDILTTIEAPLSADVIVAQTDRDDSGELELVELAALSYLAQRYVDDPLALAAKLEDRLPRNESGGNAGAEESARTGATPEKAPETAQVVDARSRRASDSARARLRRLDTNGDGFVEESELHALLAPTRTIIRLGALIAALDTNGDGRLDALELEHALID